MPSLRDHKSSKFTKILAMGDSKAGKTTSLISLVAAGYKLRVLDLDNLIDPLKYRILQDCPDMIDNVEYRPIRDERHASEGGAIIKGVPKAFVQATKMLDKWKYDDIDLGDPSEWGEECVLVIDSLSRLSDAAEDWAAFRQPKGKDGNPYWPAVVGDAQGAIENILATITSDTFQTNVIIIAHMQIVTMPDGTTKIFPDGPGTKLSPRIPSYFPSYILYQNKQGKRTIQTTSTPLLDLATPAPFLISESYPSEIGLVKIFEALRTNRASQPKEQSTQPLPTKLLKRI